VTISNLPSRGLRLGLALLALAVALVSPGCTDDRGSTVPDGTIDGSDIVDDTSRNEAVSCDPSNSTFDLVHHPPSMDQSQYGLPPEEPAARSVPAGASSLDTIGAAISEGTLLIELNDVYPAIQLEITLRSSGSMPFPLTHTMHGAFGMPPTSESFSQYSSLLEQDGDISHRTGIPDGLPRGFRRRRRRYFRHRLRTPGRWHCAYCR